ncbi:MAG TPA: class I SAM-dependent methyltransferase [Polyangiales bacterium]|nr:class I SAM-dependent methyltransferase [Polyangiales bacterium]
MQSGQRRATFCDFMKVSRPASPHELQRAYYERTASSYRTLHEREGSAHDRALRVIVPMLDMLEARSVLDVGAGAGRALRHFSSQRPKLELHGIEPVASLVREAEQAGVAPGTIQLGSGDALPFQDASIDVLTAFGVLHHVADPSHVIREMLRVARRAVFISDSNRFGQGRPAVRYAKLALRALGLWPLFDLVRTRGRGYMTSEGDGLFYSYSIFDSMRSLREWAPELMLVELETASTVIGPWADPLCNASTLLVGAIRR